MKKAILILILLALAGGGGWFYRVQKKKAAAAAEAQRYTVAKVELRTLRRTVDSTGEVRPKNRLNVKSPVAGRIEELLVQEGDEVKKGGIIAWVSSTERATLLDAARAKGEEELRYWEGLYRAAPLIAPLDGSIIVRSQEPGQTITANETVVVIADRLILVGQVDETDIGSIFPGQQVRVQLDAYPQSVFSGSVASIAYDSRLISNVTMYEVDVTPKNLPDFARSGMTATLTFLVEERKGVPAVPTAALEYRDGKVYVRQPAPGEPVSRPVEAGLSENSFTQITKGLEPGEEVLIPQVVRRREGGTNPFMPGATTGGRTGGRTR